ncbi:M3 family oligoendopeptidase [Cohnella suwonensis]|uniref:M3 family oligoendopeptidase n=1 Tax=Cohnella suwonensis TaxID=696072 RepID=A0ABW0LYH5_9BACL
MKDTYSLKWNLESLFPGGSSSSEYSAFVDETDAMAASLLSDLRGSGDGTPDASKLSEWTGKLQASLARLREADAFVSCVASQDMSDKKAVAWSERVQTLSAKLKQAGDLYDAKLGAVPDEAWEQWTREEVLADLRYLLGERRESAKDKLPPALEAVASELAVDGYHGWGEHYNTVVGRISIPWEEDGESKNLSVSQASNKLDDPNPDVRSAMSAKWEAAWAGQADLASDALNRLAGFRLKLYGMRGWDEPLREPLRMNRMSRATLDAMWDAVVETGVEPLKKYLSLKARLLGKEKLSWHDIEAPIASSQAKIPYAEAAEVITDAFSQFSPNMAELARTAFADSWIEAEDRAGKRPGGFCTHFPLSMMSRIFMTYSGTPGNVSTLAHELGHAYHDSMVKEMPPFAQDYAMNVAETASTFAEALVSDALLRRAESKEEKLALLDDRLQRAVAFCMNIRARFLFETRFYAARASGMLEAEGLNELMVAAQKEAYDESLEGWHPHFWAAKLHFYLTDVPFYNFPYTFGYLFSTGLVAVAEREGPSFSERYDSLLRDTGTMTVEQLAKEHLGAALDEPAFWREAVARSVADVEAFAQLIES